jgi:RNA-binding protein
MLDKVASFPRGRESNLAAKIGFPPSRECRSCRYRLLTPFLILLPSKPPRSQSPPVRDLRRRYEIGILKAQTYTTSMATLEISSSDRRSLRGLAHHLDPVVMIGQHGVTPAVLHEIDNALSSHELIKVRVLGDDRDERTGMLTQICDTLSCAPVQHLGKLFILFRPGKKKKGKADADAPPAKKEKERPRHTDFPKAPPRERASADTRPPRRETAEPAKRHRSADDDAWSDLSPRVRQRIDPNFSPEQGGERERRPRARTSAAGAGTNKPAGKPFGKSFAPRPPRAAGAAAAKPPFGSAPTARRRLREDDTAAAAPPRPTATKKTEEKRFRWKDRESWQPAERAPRPTTRSEPKTNLRGAARKTTGTRRRLREE